MGDEHQGGDPAEAFEALRGEVALMARAVQGMAAERRELDVPDYSPTLAHIEARLTEVSGRLDAIVQSPALRSTPQQAGVQLAAASADARRADHDALLRATTVMNQAARNMQGLVLADRSARDQNRWLYAFGCGGIAIGMILGAFGPGIVARDLAPAGWHWPERIATRMLGADTPWEGARQLAAISAPDSWNTMVAGAMIEQENREALARCRKAAARSDDPVKCTVTVKASDKGSEGK